MRNKEFKHDVALKKAMHLFWQKGYENTSLKELLKEMGILNGSFYNSFGNKKSLFIDILKFYDEDFVAKRNFVFKADKPFKKKIRYFFRHLFDRQQGAVCPKGCLLFNSVSSETINDIDIYKQIRSSIGNFEDFLCYEIEKAMKNKELDKHIDPKMTASVLVAYVQGMMKLSTLDYNDTKFRSQTDYFLSSLGL